MSFVSSKGNILCRLIKIELYKIFAIINRAIKGLHCIYPNTKSCSKWISQNIHKWKYFKGHSKHKMWSTTFSQIGSLYLQQKRSRALKSKRSQTFIYLNNTSINLWVRYIVWNFKGYTLKFHRKCLTHILKDTIHVHCWAFNSSQIWYGSYAFLKHPTACPASKLCIKNMMFGRSGVVYMHKKFHEIQNIPSQYSTDVLFSICRRQCELSGPWERWLWY